MVQCVLSRRWSPFVVRGVSDVIVIRADESRFLLKEKEKKKKRRTPRGRWWIVPLEKSRDVYLSRTLNITLSEGKNQASVWQREIWRVLKPGGVCCSPGSSIDVNTIGRRIVVRDALRHRWSGFIQGERVPLPSVSLSFDPFVRLFQSADYASMWLVVALYACVCFVYVYVILGISDDGTFNPSWMVGKKYMDVGVWLIEWMNRANFWCMVYIYIYIW